MRDSASRRRYLELKKATLKQKVKTNRILSSEEYPKVNETGWENAENEAAEEVSVKTPEVRIEGLAAVEAPAIGDDDF